MKQILLTAAALAVIALVWKVGTGGPPVRQEPNTTSSSTVTPPTAKSATPVTAASPSTAPKPDTIKIDRDPATVFQRSFWRRLDESVRVVGAERREWLEAGTTVQKWEWFLAVDTKPEFRRWLLEQNPFELTRKNIPARASDSAEIPTWFPAADKLAAFTTYANHEGRFLVFLDEKTGRLFATDRGGGFAAAAQPLK